MIDEAFLKELAIKNQTTVLNLAREYFQHRFLNFFYQEKESRRIFFKGGTALKLVFESPRFSEDLDFSADFRNCQALEKLTEGALLELEREGIRAEIIEAKATTGGCLFIFQTKIIFDLSLKLDVSLRKTKLVGERVLVKNPLSPAYSVLVLETKELVKEKIAALLERKQARDFFDLYFLLRARLATEVILARRREILELVSKEPGSFWEKELRPFLPKSYHSLLADFPRVLAKELERL